MFYFKIGFNFRKHFLNRTIYWPHLITIRQKVILIKKSTFTFKDTGLDRQGFKKKYEYVTRFKFW